MSTGPPGGPANSPGVGAAGSRGWRRRRRLVILAGVLVLVVAFFAFGVVETYRVEIKEYTFSSPEVPGAFDGTRVVLLTDIHRSGFFSQGRVGRVVDRANALRPDLVLLGGDYVYGNTGYEQSAFAELARLQAPHGRFAVLGNHDYGIYDDGDEGAAPAEDAIAASGIALLDNQGVWIEKSGQRIRLGGVSDILGGDPDAAPVVAGTATDDFVLLVSHNPDYSDKLPPGAVDLVLSGHTHGGQVTFFGLWAPYVASEHGQAFRTGMVRADATTLVISNGIGTIFPPIRFFARPQIVVITLESDPQP